jgi:hypothetical protein
MFVILQRCEEMRREARTARGLEEKDTDFEILGWT